MTDRSRGLRPSSRGLRPRPAAALVAAVALLLGACKTHEPDTRPFHVRITVGDEPLATLFPEDGVIEFTGAGIPESADSLVVRDAFLTATGEPLGADVRITFDRSALPDLAFPEFLAGVPVRVRARVAPLGLGPSLEPLTIPGIRVFTEGTPPVSQLVVWEGTYTFEDSAARVLAPAGPSNNDPAVDYPHFFVEKQWLDTEPGECGLVFYDNLIVGSEGDDTQVTGSLRRGESMPFVVGDALPTWTVAHVASWHRDGTCADQSKVFTQFAAWRPPPPAAP